MAGRSTATATALSGLIRAAVRQPQYHNLAGCAWLGSSAPLRTSGMKLLTHNLMKSHVKGVSNGYPLALSVSEMQEVEMEFNPEFVARMLPRIHYPVLQATAVQIGLADPLPAEMPESPEEDEAFLRAMHHVLMEVQIVAGELTCPESGVKFPIANGIPNMLLPEAER